MEHVVKLGISWALEPRGIWIWYSKLKVVISNTRWWQNWQKMNTSVVHCMKDNYHISNDCLIAFGHRKGNLKKNIAKISAIPSFWMIKAFIRNKEAWEKLFKKNKNVSFFSNLALSLAFPPLKEHLNFGKSST